MTNLNPAYVHTKYKIEAKVGGIKFDDDVIAISATFGLNSIPTASITVAVGHDARSGRKTKAKIHDAKQQLKPRDKVEIWVTLTSTAGSTQKMESGRIKIFDGFLAGIGYQRSHNSANYVIQAIHWLDDLNNSSALNGKWFPNAPFLMATNAAFAALQTEGDTLQTEGDTWSSVPIIDANQKLITQGNINSNLWGKVIKPLFKKMASYKTPHGQPNDAALKALERMPDAAPSVDGAVPLALNVRDLGLNVEHSIRTALTKDALESFAYTTFWSALVGDYASQFFFAVSPGVEEAYVIPFFGGLKFGGSDKLIIHADDYSYANFNSIMQQLIENVTVFWPGQQDPMLMLGGEKQSTDRFTEPAGYFPPGAGEMGGSLSQGLKLYKDLPTWLSNMSPWPIMSGKTTGEAGKRPGDCLAPQTGEADLPAGWDPPEKIANKMANKVCERFAKHFYQTEFLSQRFGELSGKLRFDIAPGSIVKIQLPDTELDEGGDMIAAVTKVSYAINSERALAGTSFDLSYVRTEREDKIFSIASATAPLYNGVKWPGHTLKK